MQQPDQHTSPVTLIVSATVAECAPIVQMLTGCAAICPGLFKGVLQGRSVEILISGVGSIATTYTLTRLLSQRTYTRCLSVGIAGSFADDVAIGEVVQITRDCFVDIGIDDRGRFLTFREAGLTDADGVFSGDMMTNPSPVCSPCREVCGVTVQIASGSRKRINELVNRCCPQVETMENAAFFHVCQMLQIPFASFRAISNRVEPRNRKDWRIAEAIEQANVAVADWLTNGR